MGLAIYNTLYVNLETIRDTILVRQVGTWVLFRSE